MIDAQHTAGRAARGRWAVDINNVDAYVAQFDLNGLFQMVDWLQVEFPIVDSMMYDKGHSPALVSISCSVLMDDGVPRWWFQAAVGPEVGLLHNIHRLMGIHRFSNSWDFQQDGLGLALFLFIFRHTGLTAIAIHTHSKLTFPLSSLSVTIWPFRSYFSR